jgi:hypothetical protein
VPIEKIQEAAADEVVDILGIATNVTPVSKITSSRTQKEVHLAISVLICL